MKVVNHTNHRVVVEPHAGYGKSSSQCEKEICKSIVADIERHVDEVHDVWIQYDTEVTCSHCGYEWEVQEEDGDIELPIGIPLCCNEAQYEWEKEQREATYEQD